MRANKFYVKQDTVFVECPHCRVCTTKISSEEFNIIKTGQSMVIKCPLCHTEFIVSEV